MNKKTVWIGILSWVMLLTGCGNIDKGTTNVDPKKTGSKATVSTGRIDNSVYQSLMVDGKYETSSARGMSASRLNSNYNLTNFENGLLHLSHDQFNVDDYFFREGQEIDEDTLRSWLYRKSENNPKGLNPENEAEPIIFQQLLEQDFIKKDSQTVGGISLGIALNRIYYSEDGEIEIDQEVMKEEGRQIASKVLARVRSLEGLSSIPITISLFEQAPKDNLAGGHYFAKGISQNGGKSIDTWEEVNEEYIVLPVINEEDNQATNDGLDIKFNDFKNAVQGFFPNLSGISGIAYYHNDALNKLTIKVETKYFSKTEIISFTQYIGKTAESIFNMKTNIEIQINSVEGMQAFVEKSAEAKQFYSHVFD